MKDMLGREIKVGDYVAYGSRDRDYGKLAIYHVKKVSERFFSGPSMYVQRWQEGKFVRGRLSTVSKSEQALRLDIIPWDVVEFLSEEER